MPVYEYVCKKCEFPFELLVMGSEVPECPNCHSKKLLKRFSTFAVSDASKPPPVPPGCDGCPSNQGPGSCGQMG